jgi:phage shock protein E
MDKTEPPPSNRAKPAYMNLLTWILIVGAVAAFLLVKSLTQIRPAAAREWLHKGALVIDVRTPAEFQERHLPGVVNIPLDRLGDEIARHTPDKARPLLLHCRSGTRSSMGTSTLKKLGYQHVFNLGSYGRAEEIVGTRVEVRKQD